MKENNTDIINYPPPVLRVAFRKSQQPLAVKDLLYASSKKEKKPATTLPDDKNKSLPEFYEHQIRPKKFDFY